MRKLRDNNNDRVKSSKSKDCGSCVTLWLSLPKSLTDIPVKRKSHSKVNDLSGLLHSWCRIRSPSDQASG
jgi:hypothetical protein